MPRHLIYKKPIGTALLNKIENVIQIAVEMGEDEKMARNLAEIIPKLKRWQKQ